jgi:histone H3/H4
MRSTSTMAEFTRNDDGDMKTDWRKGNDDLSLPKATVQKIITEILAHEPGIAFARETRDLLIECCVEFITLISSEANEIAEKEAKKTIACEHVTSALEQLGYPDYVPEILKVAHEHKSQQAVSLLLIHASYLRHLIC